MRYDVIVAGLGGMGSAVAAHAARRGFRVLGLEQFDPLHGRGASTGRTRIIRKAYFEDPGYVPMLHRAYELWRDLEAATGINVMELIGLLLVGEPDGRVIAGSKRSAAIHGLAIEELSADDLARRFPMIRPRSHEVGVFEPEAGFVRPEAAVDAHLRLARAYGADLRFGERITGWTASEGRVSVSVEGGEAICAERLALCLGPWFVKHLGALGVPIRVQRNVQMWFAPIDGRFALGRMPAFLVERPDYPRALYGFPDMGEGVKAAFHAYGAAADPDDLQRDVTDDDVVPVRAALEDFLPGAGGRLLDHKACMYSMTPDEHFVIGRDPEHPNVAVAGGFSGHGYKFASVVGEIVTDLLENGRTPFDITFISPDRFAPSA